MGVGDDGRKRAVYVVPLDADGNDAEAEAGVVYKGTVKRKDVTFGFVICADVGDVFFHKNDFEDLSEWEICFAGSDIDLQIGRNPGSGRLRACRVRLTSRI